MMSTFTVEPGELSGGVITDVVALGSEQCLSGYEIRYVGEGEDRPPRVHVIEFPPEPEPDDTKEFFPFIVPEIEQQGGDIIQPDEEQETKAA